DWLIYGLRGSACRSAGRRRAMWLPARNDAVTATVRSAPPSRARVRHACVDDLESGCKGVFGVQRACVDDDCVPRGNERGDASLRIAGVAFLHLPQNAAMYSAHPTLSQLLKPAFGAHLQARGD